MIPRPGLVLDRRYLPNLKWKRDLQVFQIPLLSEYVDSRGDSYLLHWCDFERPSHRWLLVRVPQRDILQLASGLITLRERLQRALVEGAAFLVETSEENGPFEQITLVTLENVPTRYLPSDDQILDEDLFPESARPVYSILLNGEWEMDELAAVPRKFADAHALLLQFEAQRSHPFHDYPWRGGFSSMHFFKAARQHADPADRPRLVTIHVSSPGYLQLAGDRHTALRVGAAVRAFESNLGVASTAFKNLEGFIRDAKLNERDPFVLSAEESKALNGLGSSLARVLREPSWDWLLTLTPDAFKSAKVLMAYYRRLGDLAELSIDGRIAFPRI